MALLSARPKISQLTFGLYGRSLHPEFFEIHSTRRLERDHFVAQVDVTSSGHVIMFRTGGRVFTELATSAHQELPDKRRLLTQKLSGNFEDRIECEGGVHFEYQFHLDRTTPDIFYSVQKAFELRQEMDGLLYRFPSSGRVELGAFSYIYIDTRVHSLRVQALHTFPDDYTILKTQSLFRIENHVAETNATESDPDLS